MRKLKQDLKLLKKYDYRIECEGKKPGSVDPIRLYFQKKRMQSILAVSKRRKISSHMSELLTTGAECHVIAQHEDNTSTTLATYDMPQYVSILPFPDEDISSIVVSFTLLSLPSHISLFISSFHLSLSHLSLFYHLSPISLPHSR